MELKQAVQILKDHNEWRRDNISSIPISRTTRSKELGIAIDVVVDHLTDYKCKHKTGLFTHTENGNKLWFTCGYCKEKMTYEQFLKKRE